MALSKQITPTSSLNRFMAWAKAAGYHVGEHPAYGGVTPARAHPPARGTTTAWPPTSTRTVRASAPSWSTR